MNIHTTKLILCALIACLLWQYGQAQNITVSNYYKEDRDGDGVPDIRDQCPDTDKNLNGQEFVVNVDGKEHTIKIVDLKGNFELRRRRILVEISRLDRENRAMLREVNNKPEKLSAEQQQKKALNDSLMTQKRGLLSNLAYEGKITTNGKTEIVEVMIGVDEWGCLPDRDKDGIPDLVDKCPDNPGIPRYFGCNDRDGDTVLDHEDDCPDEPGLVELKGCPDKGLGDRDKDGTIDRDDLCPDVFGPKENKGCPDLVSKEEKKIIEAASKVLFDSGKATLRPESFGILDELADLILKLDKKYDNLKIRLEGHTDTDGTNEDNLELSRNRSRTVKEYLISKGITINIATAGYGEERLKVAVERSPADKQENRRVEIAITNEE